MATMINSLGQGPQNPMEALHADGEAANAKLGKLETMGELMRKTRQELDGLVKMRDTVTEEDVITAVGKIVAAGGKPMEMASMLADAPFHSKEALQAWVAQKDTAVRQMEMQLQMAEKVTRHELANAGLHMMSAQYFMDQAQGGPPDSAPAGEGPSAGGMGQAPAEGGPGGPPGPMTGDSTGALSGGSHGG